MSNKKTAAPFAKNSLSRKYWLFFWLIIAGSILLHLINLVKLPVFADESIYIRWAQLIIDDWRQYLFFPLNDGKTPIFIWALTPYQFIFQDRLFAGRFVSVLVGAAQVGVMGLLAKKLNLSKRVQLLTMILTAVLPYWFFHHHLALMDGMLTLWISLACLMSITLASELSKTEQVTPKVVIDTLGIGLFFGLAILTKIPALLLFPAFIFFALIQKQKDITKWSKLAFFLSISIISGLGLFLLLKLHPAFSQLFTRGGDFLFSWQEILLKGRWQETTPSIPNYINYFGHYLTWPILFLSVLGIFLKPNRKTVLLHLSWLSFALPIFIMGKVVFARYLFPVSPFITLAAAVSINQLMQLKPIVKKIVFIVLVLAFIQSASFISALQLNPEAIPFVPSDRHQYLTEWSAGYGVKETVEIIQEIALNQKVFVLSEGYFGTLPDGLLMYLHRQNVDNVFIQPVGQPVHGNRLTEYSDKAQEYDLVLLVANSHRLTIDLEEQDLIYQNCRPFDAPCHQIWNVTEYLSK